METLTLQYPIRTLDRRVLLPAGTVLSPETLDTLIHSTPSATHRSYPILQHGSVKTDLLKFLSAPPCRVIFDNRAKVTDLLNLMGTVHLILPFLQSIDYFKRYDFYTYRHILMVFALSSLLAKDLVSDYQDLVREAATGPTHDLGKTCVPLRILQKNTPISRTEKGIIEHHSIAGYVLITYYLKDSHNLAARIARDHHERKDSSGYPRGIALTDRMVEIIAVCDIYDALMSPRPYRPVSFDNRTALEEITKLAEENKISWDVVKALVAHNRRTKLHFSECEVSLDKRGSPPPGNLHGVIAEEKDNQHQKAGG